MMVDKLDVTIRDSNGDVVFEAKGQELQSYCIHRPEEESPKQKGFGRFEPSANAEYTFKVKA